MQLVKYVQGLGWTQEQLVFLAFAGLVLVLAITLIRALKRAFTGRKETSRLIAELDELLERVSSLEAELDEKSEVDRAVERCLKALEAGWPQHDTEMAKAAMGMLLAQAATHPDRNKALWQALLTRSATLRVTLGNDKAAKASLHLRAVPTVTSVGEIRWNCQSRCVLMRGGVAASFRFNERAGL